MSTNHGRLCRDIIGGSLRIKDKVVVDRDCHGLFHSLKVNDLLRTNKLEANRLEVAGNVTVSENLFVKAICIDDDLKVVGQIRGPITFSDDVTFSDGLCVEGNAKFNGGIPTLTIDELCVRGNAKIVGTVTADMGGIQIAGNCILASDGQTQVCVTEGLVELCGDNIDVKGETRVQGNLQVQGDLSVTGTIIGLPPQLIGQNGPKLIQGQETYTVLPDDSSLLIDAYSCGQLGADLNGNFFLDRFGSGTALSADGSILIATGSGGNERSQAFQWNGSNYVTRGGSAFFDQTGPVAVSSDGDTYIVAVRSGTNGRSRVLQWTPTFNPPTYIAVFSISGTAAGANEGRDVDISADGNTVVSSAPGNSTNFVRVFERPDSSSPFVQKGSTIPAPSAPNNGFGSSVALSADGNILAVGFNTFNSSTGLVAVYDWDGMTWVKRTNDVIGAATLESFGTKVRLTSDGNTLVVSRGFSGGALSVYDWDSMTATWIQRGALIDSGVANDGFSSSLYSKAFDIDNDTKNILAVGANRDNQAGGNAGKVYLYCWNGSTWKLQNEFLGTTVGEGSGNSVSLSSDAGILAIGSPDLNLPAGSFVGRVRVFGCSNETTLTLPLASTYPGKIFFIRANANDVTSDSNNVIVPFNFTPGSTVLTPSDEWVMIQSDGTNWIVVTRNSSE